MKANLRSIIYLLLPGTPKIGGPAKGKNLISRRPTEASLALLAYYSARGNGVKGFRGVLGRIGGVFEA
jgi:hypothetical protein